MAPAPDCTPAHRAVPFDLVRHELLMTLKPVPDEVIESIVDEVFMPLVLPSAQPRPTTDSP